MERKKNKQFGQGDQSEQNIGMDNNNYIPEGMSNNKENNAMMYRGG